MNWKAFSVSLCFFSIAGSFVAEAATDGVKSIERNIVDLEKEIQSLQSKVRGLDEVQSELSVDLMKYEKGLKERLRSVIVPLLSWPDRLFTTRTESWVEFERSQILLMALRRNLVLEPLKLLSDRELRLQEVKNLRAEMEEKLGTLESKEQLLNLQLEELQLLDKRPARTSGIPAATARNKKKIGDIERPLR